MNELEALHARYDGPLPLPPVMTGLYCWEMLLRRHLATRPQHATADTAYSHALIRRLRAGT